MSPKGGGVENKGVSFLLSKALFILLTESAVLPSLKQK
jgi:hypothetical protein